MDEVIQWWHSVPLQHCYSALFNQIKLANTFSEGYHNTATLFAENRINLLVTKALTGVDYNQ